MAGLPARHLRQPRPAWRWRARRRRGGRPATDPRGAGRRSRKSAGEPAGRHRGRGGRRLPERQRAEGLLRAAGRCHGGRRPGDLRRHLRLRRRQRQRRQARRPRPGDRPGPRVQRPHRAGRAAAGQRPGERRGLADAGRHQPAAGQRRCAGALRRHARAAPPDADRQRGLQPRPLRRGPAVLRRPPDDSDQRGGSRRTGQGHAGAQRPRPDSPRRRPQRAEPRPDPLPGAGTERLQQPARRRPYQRHRRRARLLGRQLPYPAVADADLRGGQSASGPAGGGRAPAGGQLQRAQLLQRRWQGRRFPHLARSQHGRGVPTAESEDRRGDPRLEGGHRRPDGDRERRLRRVQRHRRPGQRPQRQPAPGPALCLRQPEPGEAGQRRDCRGADLSRRQGPHLSIRGGARQFGEPGVRRHPQPSDPGPDLPGDQWRRTPDHRGEPPEVEGLGLRRRPGHRRRPGQLQPDPGARRPGPGGLAGGRSDGRQGA